MNIDDFYIKVKKYDKKTNSVILNVTVCDILEVRGFRVTYTTTKHSPLHPVWIANPPATRGRNKQFFWIVRITDSALWQQLEKKLIEVAEDYTITHI